MRCLPLATLLVIAPLASAADPVNFSRDVLPILSDNCFHCHGPDAKSREAELRLDHADSALRKEKPIIVPGKSGESELVKRLRSTDPDEVMPPPKSNRKLTPLQIDTIARWIDGGAAWGKHWAFETPVRPGLPAVKRTDWPRNPIDHFILAKLEQTGWSPSPEARRETLIRRVSLDLTGLPPTPAEVDAFLADGSPDAYEKVVDRLLKSPRFGERMVWDWLDAARYADTNGYQGDPTRAMHYWRDWVIDALNQNLPFDRFTIEQLAGDLLPNPTTPQLIATGFHRNHMINGEGGRIAEESRVDYVQDRVETTGTVWLGLTFNCCRCHDHKYDPFTQREYYQLAAYFNSIDESGANDAGGLANPVLSFATPEQQKRIEELRVVERDANKARDNREKQLGDEFAKWEETIRGTLGKQAELTWQPLVPVEAVAEKGTQFTISPDGSILATGTSPDADDYVLTVKTKLGPITGIKVEPLPDDSFVNKGPGRADNGNFVLSEFQVQTADGKRVDLTAMKATFEQKGWPVVNAVDGKFETGWAVMPEFGKSHTALFEVRSPVPAAEETKLTIRLAFRFGRQHTLGRFRISATTEELRTRTLVDDVKAALLKPADQRSEAERKKLAEFHRDSDPQYLAAKKRSEDAKRDREATEKAAPRTMVMRERAQPRDTFILVRGQYNKFGDKVAHGTPTSLPPLPADAGKNRLALAQWLMSPEHPLTSRVTVNRYWQTIFGNGLVKSAEDFGVQGEKPSHPELLDWLACEFRQPTVSQPTVVNSDPQNAWNVKHILRLKVTSATYRQSSAVRGSQTDLQSDPENRLLSRGPRYRLPSWMIRDQSLAVSGLLVEKQGGPPVKGYQPPGIWEEATFGKIGYQQDRGESLYRRSLYQFWRRIVGPTVFFDVANRQTCQVKTSRTNTPLHSLVTLNDVTYVEAARSLAERLLHESGSDEDRITLAYRLVLSRRPTPAESQVLLASLSRLRSQFVSTPDSARKLLTVGESKRDEKLDPAEHAAFTSLCSLILNLDESLTRE